MNGSSKFAVFLAIAKQLRVDRPVLRPGQAYMNALWMYRLPLYHKYSHSPLDVYYVDHKPAGERAALTARFLAAVAKDLDEEEDGDIDDE